MQPQEQCSHVEEYCPRSDTFLSLDYLHYYFCADHVLRPFLFAALVSWLFFLFSTLGISASDFFTPNLASIAQLLGLDENVAGVTFLAFGNGSPDLFSTLSAMRADMGSLAIGELLGAASFIVSCVVGSMCIIKPFRVHRAPFFRDVGFFFIAVTLVFVILYDGEIRMLEAGVLVGMYVLYASVVVIGSWWERRQERKRENEELVRNEYGADMPVFPPYSDNRKLVFHIQLTGLSKNSCSFYPYRWSGGTSTLKAKSYFEPSAFTNFSASLSLPVSQSSHFPAPAFFSGWRSRVSGCHCIVTESSRRKCT